MIDKKSRLTEIHMGPRDSSFFQKNLILYRAAAINDDPFENSSENAQYRCKRQIGILLFRRMR